MAVRHVEEERQPTCQIDQLEPAYVDAHGEQLDAALVADQEERERAVERAKKRSKQFLKLALGGFVPTAVIIALGFAWTLIAAIAQYLGGGPSQAYPWLIRTGWFLAAALVLYTLWVTAFVYFTHSERRGILGNAEGESLIKSD